MSSEKLKNEYTEWVKENLGPKVGIWYTPYLKRMGEDLSEFSIADGFKTNFFEYDTFDEFSEVYKELTNENSESVATILQGRNKKYPVSFGKIKNAFTEKIAQREYERGTRSKPTNHGGIASLGAVLRSYLKFLYYREHPEKDYPKTVKDTTKDEETEYWVFQPGPRGIYWKEFYEKGIVAIGWDYLGDATVYESQNDIQEAMKEYEGLNHEPFNSSLAVWQFTNQMKPGDIVYVKQGTDILIGKGTVVGDYQFDEDRKEYKHVREVKWSQKGEWQLEEKITSKVLTRFTVYPNWIEKVESLFQKDKRKQKKSQEESYGIWLSERKQADGSPYDERIIRSRIEAIKDFEKDFDVSIFTEKDANRLEEIKEKIISKEKEGSYKKHAGNIRTSLDSYIEFITTKPDVVVGNDPYTDQDFLEEVFMDQIELDKLKSLMKHKKNIILRGAPGVGKTYIADRLAYVLMGEKDETRMNLVQFHQSYSYEDFIEGFRPKEEGDGFELSTGPFVQFAERASQDSRPYFFIIDEINRGNMSKIFGELMMLIEEDKRGKEVNLLYSNKKFSVPKNLYIIGTMNTADRSLAMLDYALRRRFAFYDLTPAFDKTSFGEYISEYEDTDLIRKMVEQVKQLNLEIENSLGTGFQIGHSYFTDQAIKENTRQRLEEVLEYEVIPQLHEYWFDEPERVEREASKLKGVLRDGNQNSDS